MSNNKDQAIMYQETLYKQDKTDKFPSISGWNDMLTYYVHQCQIITENLLKILINLLWLLFEY